MEERRATVRQRSYLGASVEHSGTSSLACLVRDVTEHGARLRFGVLPTVGNLLDLVIANKPPHRSASVVWRRGLELGVTFAQ